MFGNNLKKYRLIRGYSQSQLASKLYVTRQCVSKWEKGVTEPDMETLLKISKLLDVSVDDLLSESNSIGNRKHLDANWVLFVVNALTALFCAINFVILWRFLPSIIPAHWTGGTIDRYGSSTEILLNLITVAVFCAFSLIFFTLLRRADINKVAIVVQCTIVIAQVVYYIFILAMYAKYLTDLCSFATCVSSNIILCVSAAMHPKITRQNRWFGVRTASTLKSEVVWDKTNALACYLFTAVSLVILIVNMAIVFEYSYLCLLAYVLPTITTLVYSKHISINRVNVDN